MRELKHRLKDAEARARQAQPDLDDKQQEIQVTLCTYIVNLNYSIGIATNFYLSKFSFRHHGGST